jgi:hypothetical protein
MLLRISLLHWTRSQYIQNHVRGPILNATTLAMAKHMSLTADTHSSRPHLTWPSWRVPRCTPVALARSSRTDLSPDMNFF